MGKGGSRGIGFVGFRGVAALDVIGPLDAFAAANALAAANAPAGVGARPYETVLLTAGAKRFASESGVLFEAGLRLDEAPELDTILVPGGAGLRVPRVCRRVAAWLRERAPLTRRVATICTGAYALAASGLLDGRRATTHWRFAADLAQRHPAVRFEADRIFVRDGRYATSAGVTAGIDLALAFVEEDLGSDLALAVARELVVYVKRAGGQLQYSEPLRFQTGASGAFAQLGDWIVGNLAGDLATERLAERAGLSERHFRRRFTAATGATPAAYVERLRLDEARRRLETASGIEAVAHSVGYRSADAFRRAFERAFGIAPSTYRARFSFPAGDGA